MNTPFDKFFDYNHDGKLDWMEKGARDAAIMGIISRTEQENQLRDAGLDYDELASMTDWEREEALSDAGLDADDFDF